MSIPEHVPFKRYFKNRMLTGKKTATSRTKMLGKPGDRFEAFGEWFQFFKVDRMMLGDVAKLFFHEEGFETKEDFLDCWAEIHPRAKFDLTKPVYLHQFVIVEKETKQ